MMFRLASGCAIVTLAGMANATVAYFSSTASLTAADSNFYKLGQIPDLHYNPTTGIYSYSNLSSTVGQIQQFGSTAEGRSTANSGLKVETGIIKATLGSGASAGITINPFGQSPNVSSSALQTLNIQTLDQIRFLFSDPLVNNAKIKVTFYAAIETSTVNIIDRDTGRTFERASWNYHGDVRIHRTDRSAYGNAVGPELISIEQWSVGGAFGVDADRFHCRNFNQCYNTGYSSVEYIFDVQNGNALWVLNGFSAQSQSRIELFYAPTRAMRTGSVESTIGFGNSGYTFIEIFTPGVSYVSQSGGRYLTQLPTGPAIPEPATWAMMLAGFGLVGTSIRRRRNMLRIPS